MNQNNISISFTEGPKVEIIGNDPKEYHIIFYNENKQVVSQSKITTNMWCSALIRYYEKWTIEVRTENETIVKETFSLKNKRAKILIDNSDIKEVLSIIDLIDQFQKLHECHIDCIILDEDLQKTLSKSYNNISFYFKDSGSTDYYVTYIIAKFEDHTYYTKVAHSNKDFKKIAMDVLGIDIPFETDEPITIVTAHPHKQHVVDVLKTTLKQIKTKIILSVNHTVDQDIQKMCDYVVYDKDNALLRKDEYDSHAAWFFHIKSDGSHVFFEFEHSYAVYKLIKNGLEMANSLGYKKIHFINYDYQLTDETFKEQLEHLSTHDVVVYGGYNSTHSMNGYDSSCWAANIDKILPIFRKYKSKYEYYLGGAGPASCAFLELKLSYTIEKFNLNIKTLSITKLMNENKANIVTDVHW